MRGGSRYGAGRPGWNSKVESLLKIDIGQWASQGKLVPGNHLTFTWSRESQTIASIAIIVSQHFLTFKYNWTPDGQGRAQNISEHVPLERTACNYGGSRVWFQCPSCNRRAAILYLVKGHWYCRKSLNVRYASQSMDVMDRMHRRIAKWENKLAEEGEKPKGMHRATYNRIIEKLSDAESRLDAAFYQKAGRLLGFI